MNSLLRIVVHYYIQNILLAGCLLNFHEGVRTQATSWIPFAWMPAYDDQLAPNRDKAGFESHTARRVRLEHEALSHVFKDWDVRTKDAMQLYWGGKILRSSKLYLAAVVVDHPQLDKFVGGG
jgi:hypothetical protein